MYELVWYIPDGSARYYNAIADGFSGNPFNATEMTLEGAGYALDRMVEKGYNRKDLEIVGA